MVISVLAAIASAWGVLMGLSPVLQIRRMLRQHSSREVSLGYFSILLAGFLRHARRAWQNQRFRSDGSPFSTRRLIW